MMNKPTLSNIHCLGCGSEWLVQILDLGTMPLVNYQLRSFTEEAPAFPLCMLFCKACALVQLSVIVDPVLLFHQYSYLSSFSQTYLQHCEDLVGYLVNTFNLNHHSSVLEIASNDGYLLQYFRKRKIHCLGIEPAVNIAEMANRRGIHTISEFFGMPLVDRIIQEFGKCDIILGNNVLAHVPAINEFLTAVKLCLKSTGVAVFEVPYLMNLIDHAQFDTIYSEHVFYYSVTSLMRLAQTNGLRVFDAELVPVHGGSLRVYLRVGNNYDETRTPRLAQLLGNEVTAGVFHLSYYQKFAKLVELRVHNVKDVILDLVKRKKSVAAYGASAKGAVLLNYCHLNHEIIQFAVDLNPIKIGTYIPNLKIPVGPIAWLTEKMPDYLLLTPWNIADEIIQRESGYRAMGGKFIIPTKQCKIL